ncbi:MAG TPA: family 20 glycosylhydrolase, partial [Saprospiraceae bacterium]|nr:family 20 glycosylhydrolase [Saprospiraceae bacterium]
TVFHTSFTDTLLRRIDENYKIVNQSAEGNIIIEFDEAIKPEGYYLEINEKLVIIRASDPNGAQYGLTSLTQMYIYDGIKLPICKIQDRPKFRYRGMHLDVGRHMFTITEIKRYLDYLAEYKYNYFHWHLTEDQGWRIEIKKYPKLTEIGGFRKETLIGHYDDLPHQFDGKKYGGFYTQEQIKDIVAYAAERNITVVPEIEMPGHALAALAAYPHLGCSGGPYEVATKWGVFEDVFCPYDSTFLFLEDVLDEVIALFPSKYIHIGGDECPKESWKNNEFCQNLIKEFDLKDEHGLQSYFIQRIERYINSKGRQIIGWDEILEGGLAPNATVMSWRGNEGGINAANQDHDVIMTPGSHCYFDFYQSESDQEPRAIGGLTTVEKVYHWDVVPEELSRRKRKFILGGQANLWTEYIPTFKQVAYMAFARGMAMSEALWSEGKNYENFLVRYEKHNDRLTSKGYNIANHLYDIKTKVDITDEGKVSVGFEGMKGIQVECIDPQGELSMTPINQKYLISISGQYTFKSVKGDRKGRDQKLTFDLHKGTTSKVTLEDMPSEQYSRNGILSLINGVNGSSQKFNDGEWLGFEGTNCNITFELVREETIQSIELRFFNGETQWIHLPKEVRILVSTDGEIFQDVYLENKISSLGKISELNIDMKNIMVKYIKILITNYGIIEEGKPGAGNKAWLFVDEVKIK